MDLGQSKNSKNDVDIDHYYNFGPACSLYGDDCLICAHARGKYGGTSFVKGGGEGGGLT